MPLLPPVTTATLLFNRDMLFSSSLDAEPRGVFGRPERRVGMPFHSGLHLARATLLHS
jgi:hypothetical protein